MAQNYSSADTSVNTTKLPFLFSHLESLIGKVEKPNHYILDIGCGKYTTHIAEKVKSLGWEYIGYDPYNQSEAQRDTARFAMAICPISIATMSNVVNVIDDDQAMLDAIRMGTERAASHTVLVTIYEGDKTGIGRVTKQDCYQRNMKRKDYLPLLKSAGFYCMRIPNGFAVSNVPFAKNK